MAARRRIADLADMVAGLPDEERERFEGIFHVSCSVGRVNPPPSMREWIEAHFGSVDAVVAQRVARITNLVTMEAAMFNELRSQRPVVTEKPEEVDKVIADEAGGPFCRPLENTPEDVFGRIQGRHSVTASNIAKFDGWSGVVIFDEHNPFALTEERVSDYIDTAMEWARRAHESDGDARYPFFLWNCLWRAGASIVHGHAQVMVARGMHYAKVEHLRRAALEYARLRGRNYFEDLYLVHDSLGLALEVDGSRVLSYLSPIKEREVVLISEELGDAIKGAIYRVLDCYVRGLGVRSFNVAVCMSPLGSSDEDWGGFPVVARILDRGDPMNRTADMAAMELYASSVVSSDPFQVIEALREWIAG